MTEEESHGDNCWPSAVCCALSWRPRGHPGRLPADASGSSHLHGAAGAPATSGSAAEQTYTCRRHRDRRQRHPAPLHRAGPDAPNPTCHIHGWAALDRVRFENPGLATSGYSVFSMSAVAGRLRGATHPDGSIRPLRARYNL